MDVVKKSKRGIDSFVIWQALAYFSIVFGLGVSGYLSYVKLLNQPIVCAANSVVNCGVVTNSSWSVLVGIPIAYLGFGMYGVLGLLLWFEKRVSILQDNGLLLIFAITLVGWIYSMWLVYVQFVILDALCPWCLSHEANITVFFGLVLYRMYDEVFKLDA